MSYANQSTAREFWVDEHSASVQSVRVFGNVGDSDVVLLGAEHLGDLWVEQLGLSVSSFVDFLSELFVVVSACLPDRVVLLRSHLEHRGVQLVQGGVHHLVLLHVLLRVLGQAVVERVRGLEVLAGDVMVFGLHGLV